MCCGARKSLSLGIPAVLALDRIDRLAELADAATSRIEPLGIFGLNFGEELRPALWNVRLGKGVIVVGQAPGFNSVDTRLQPGDLIHALNGTPIESVERPKSAVAQLKPGHAAVLRIERQGQFQYVALEME